MSRFFSCCPIQYMYVINTIADKRWYQRNVVTWETILFVFSDYLIVWPGSTMCSIFGYELKQLEPFAPVAWSVKFYCQVLYVYLQCISGYTSIFCFDKTTANFVDMLTYNISWHVVNWSLRDLWRTVTRRRKFNCEIFLLVNIKNFITAVGPLLGVN